MIDANTHKNEGNRALLGALRVFIFVFSEKDLIYKKEAGNEPDPLNFNQGVSAPLVRQSNLYRMNIAKHLTRFKPNRAEYFANLHGIHNVFT